jgi:hypothetical protein
VTAVNPSSARHQARVWAYHQLARLGLELAEITELLGITARTAAGYAAEQPVADADATPEVLPDAVHAALDALQRHEQLRVRAEACIALRARLRAREEHAGVALLDQELRRLRAEVRLLHGEAA